MLPIVSLLEGGDRGITNNVELQTNRWFNNKKRFCGNPLISLPPLACPAFYIYTVEIAREVIIYLVDRGKIYCQTVRQSLYLPDLCKILSLEGGPLVIDICQNTVQYSGR